MRRKQRQWRVFGNQNYLLFSGLQVCTVLVGSVCLSVISGLFAYLLITKAFSALTLLVGRQEEHLACKKHEWWDAGMVICLERDADLHMAQLMPLPLTVSCFSKIQIGFTFLVQAHLGSPGKRAVKRVCMCVCVRACVSQIMWYRACTKTHMAFNLRPCIVLAYNIKKVLLLVST